MSGKEMLKLFLKNKWNIKKIGKGSHYHLEKNGHITTIPFHATDLKKKTQEKLLKILKEVG